MLYSLIFVIHILICVLLIVVILMQASKGGGLAGTFGGGGGGLGTAMFGGRGAGSLLSKLTVWLAVALVATSVLLNLNWLRSSADVEKGLLEQELEKTNIPAPATPLDENQ